MREPQESQHACVSGRVFEAGTGQIIDPQASRSTEAGLEAGDLPPSRGPVSLLKAGEDVILGAP